MGSGRGFGGGNGLAGQVATNIPAQGMLVAALTPTGLKFRKRRAAVSISIQPSSSWSKLGEYLLAG